MNIVLNYDPVAAADPSFVADAQAAVAILNRTFTNNITLTFDIGLGSILSWDRLTQSFVRGPLAANTSAANINFFKTIGLTYSELRTNLLTSGQPNFFTPTNLPAGDSINGMANFYISSSEAKAFGLPVPTPPMNQRPDIDGWIGIGTTGFTPGPVRVAALLHEIGHAMGRVPFNLGSEVSVLDLMRFVSAGNRLFDGRIPNPLANPPVGPVPAAYFSLDGGVNKLADWGRASDPSDFLNPPASNRTPNDPFNEFVGTGLLTTADILATEALGFTSTLAVVNPPPPDATTAVMVLRQTSVPPSITDGTYQIWDIGNNAILGGVAYQLGKVGAPWQFVTLGGFNDGDTSDMLLRNASTGTFQVYDIANNNITGSASLGAVGLNFKVLGFGNFGSFGNTDMMLRDDNTGALQVYNIANNRVTGSASLGMVGLDWQFSGVGNFSSRGTSDMLLRNSDTGGLQVYDINSNAITGSFFIGNVGLDWQFSGIGNFSSVPGESDLLLRNRSTGALQVYDIGNNQLGGSFSLGAVGTDYQFAGVAPIRGAGAASDLILRSVTTGALQVYNIANNQLIGSASLGNPGSDWQLGGFAADPPTGPTNSMGSSHDLLGSNSQPPAMDGSTAQTRTSTFQLADANGNAVGSPVDPSAFSALMVNPAPPDATTANMVLRNAPTTTATYQIYNLGANSILASNSLGAQIGSDWEFVTLGNFNSSDPSDMLLRNSASGAFQVYDIVNNNIVSSTSLGTVGVEWQPMGFGTFGSFGSFGETDMILRDVNTGDLQVYQIDSNEITTSAFLGTIGLEWEFSGVGNFSGAGTSDLLLRDSITGDLEVLDISDNEITDSAFIGTVGLEWEFSGVGNFSGVPGESDLLLRDSITGDLEVLNINNHEVTGSAFIGTIGLDWQFAGVAPIRTADASDLVVRNVNTGAFQVYNIANNQLMGSAPLGQVGSEWQLGGFAPTFLFPSNVGPPLDSNSQPAAMDGSTAQLVQAMAGFDGSSGAGQSLNTVPLGADISQQTLLTTPQHA
jgi:hypothetical protein